MIVERSLIPTADLKEVTIIMIIRWFTLRFDGHVSRATGCPTNKVTDIYDHKIDNLIHKRLNDFQNVQLDWALLPLGNIYGKWLLPLPFRETGSQSPSSTTSTLLHKAYFTISTYHSYFCRWVQDPRQISASPRWWHHHLGHPSSSLA